MTAARRLAIATNGFRGGIGGTGVTIAQESVEVEIVTEFTADIERIVEAEVESAEYEASVEIVIEAEVEC